MRASESLHKVIHKMLIRQIEKSLLKTACTLSVILIIFDAMRENYIKHGRVQVHSDTISICPDAGALCSNVFAYTGCHFQGTSIPISLFGSLAQVDVSTNSILLSYRSC